MENLSIVEWNNEEFTLWFNSDNVIQVSGGWITQCTQYRKIFTYDELMMYFEQEYLRANYKL